MELRDYIRILRKSWVLISVLTLVGAGAAAAYSLTLTPTYSATAKVFVSTQGAGTTGELQQGSTFTIQRVKTYASLVSTPIVLLPVIDTLQLGVSSASLAGRVSASAPADTSIIVISVSDTDPKRAADTANAISQSLNTVVAEIEAPAGFDAGSPVKIGRASCRERVF